MQPDGQDETKTVTGAPGPAISQSQVKVGFFEDKFIPADIFINFAFNIV